MDIRLKPNAATSIKPRIVNKTPTSKSIRKTPSNSAERPRRPLFIDHEKREAMIRERAYAYCEARGASCGRELEDWLQAERDVDAALSRSA